MSDALDEIVTRYAETGLTLEEAVRVEVEKQASMSVLKERDIEIRPYPVTRDTDEIIADLARGMIIPEKTLDGYRDEYGLSKKRHDFLQAREGILGVCHTRRRYHHHRQLCR